MYTEDDILLLIKEVFDNIKEHMQSRDALELITKIECAFVLGMGIAIAHRKGNINKEVN